MIRKLLYFFRWPLIVYVLGLIIYILEIPKILPWIDIPLHLIGGFVLAYSFILILEFLRAKKLIKVNNKLIYFIIILSLVSLIAVFYEFYEFTLSYVLKIGMQGNLIDTMVDLFLGLLGGIFIFLFKQIKI